MNIADLASQSMCPSLYINIDAISYFEAFLTLFAINTWSLITASQSEHCPHLYAYYNGYISLADKTAVLGLYYTLIQSKQKGTKGCLMNKCDENKFRK